VDVNLTPLQPHHKIEKVKNKRKRKTSNVNMIPKMWGWTQLLGNAPRCCTLGTLLSNFLCFSMVSEVKPQDGSPKNIVGRFMQALDFYLFIYLH